MTNINVRTTVVQTGETFINLNDLIIKLMLMADNAQDSKEADTYKRVVDYLSQKRDKAHVPR